MTENRKFLSLRIKLALVMLGGFLAGLLGFLLTTEIGGWLIGTRYMSEEAVSRRSMAAIEDLQAYIKENNLSSRDTEALSAWSIERKDIYILFYKNRHLAMEAGWWGVDDDSSVGDQELSELSTLQLYPVSFRDGVFQAVVYDFSESRLYDAVTVVSIVIACALFALIMLLYNNRITHAIIAVSREIQQIGRGNLNAQVDTDGNDEVAQLAQSVDAMRTSLIRKTQEEQEALRKNSELITAMSHDIRNPLTVLLGYLDLARRGQYRSEEELRQCLEASYSKAEQLKTLTDELFRYALVFGGRELKLDMQEYDAEILLEQLLFEPTLALRQYGFTVQTVKPEKNCRVRVDVQYFKRVLDNLFDNVRKYADAGKPVTIAVRQEDGWLRLRIENTRRKDPGGVESNRIGLKTCEQILSQMGGSLRRYEQEDAFCVELLLPVLPEENG